MCFMGAVVHESKFLLILFPIHNTSPALQWPRKATCPLLCRDPLVLQAEERSTAGVGACPTGSERIADRQPDDKHILAI